MSASYHAFAIHGYPIPKSALSIATLNPLWGKHKFDPNTGKKVEEFLVRKVYLDDIAAKHGLEVFETTDQGEQFVGKQLAKVNIGEGGKESAPFSLYTSLQANQSKQILDVCQELGISFQPDRYTAYLIGYCSY